MLIAALLMVLFANHMDERVAHGKRVIQCRRRQMNSNDKQPLLVNSTKEKEKDSDDYDKEPV